MSHLDLAAPDRRRLLLPAEIIIALAAEIIIRLMKKGYPWGGWYMGQWVRSMYRPLPC
jgi:hypothetical protein